MKVGKTSRERAKQFFKASIQSVAALCGAGAILAASANGVVAQDFYDDGLMPNYYEASKGKTVAFVPIALTFSITQEYLAEFQAQADRLDYELVVRDPNWSIDNAVQAISQLIAEKPDIIIAHPLDGVAFNRLVRKASNEGIYWIWANLKGDENGDVYVGGNHYELDREKVKLAAEHCKTAGSNKIFLVQTPPTNYTAITGTQGIHDELKLHPELELIGIQTADSDPSKAKSIAATVLKQHPDLCAFIGQWDGADIGIVPAVAEAGLAGTVGIFTGGGGMKAEACDKVADGSFTGYVDYNINGQAKDINAAVMQLFQTLPEAGKSPYAIYQESRVINADNVDQINCWSLAEK